VRAKLREELRITEIGKDIEVKKGDYWLKVSVVAHFSGRAVIAWKCSNDCLSSILGDNDLIREIRTAKQIEDEDRRKTVMQMVSDLDGALDLGNAMEALYKAGYRKQEAK